MTGLALQASPRRPASAVRRGVRHNTRQLPDGTWTWRYDPQIGSAHGEHAALWTDLPRLRMPLMLVRGGDSVLVTEDDLAEMTTLGPAMRVEVVPGVGYGLQSDQPLALTVLISDFLLAN